jgi:transposase InsO family protein
MRRLRDQGHRADLRRIGNPWQNGCVESFNGNLRDKLLNSVWF